MLTRPRLLSALIGSALACLSVTTTSSAEPPGRPVVSLADGTVLEAGWSDERGLYIRIRHDGSYVSGYSHLQRLADGIQTGVAVRKGQVIGYVAPIRLAASGRSSAPPAPVRDASRPWPPASSAS